MKIDCMDCAYALAIGNGVRRSLIQHFCEWLNELIKTEEFRAEDSKLFSQNAIDAAAWWMTDRLIADEEHLFNSDSDYAARIIQSGVTASEYLEYRIEEVIEETKEHFLGHGEINVVEALKQFANSKPSS